MEETKNEKSPTVLQWVISLYYCQGLPFSLVRQVSVVFFKDQGASLKSLGFVALYGIPWTFKFLWAPLVDKTLSKRGWILLMELVLGALFGLIGLFAFQGLSPSFIAGVFLLVAFVAATHDIAIDGFYLDALPRDRQAKYSGWWQAGYRLALLTGVGFLVPLSAKLPWWGIFSIVGVFFILIVLWHGFVLPKPTLKKSAAPAQRVVPILEGFQTFLQLPKIGLAIAFIILFKVGDALLFGMSTPFLLDIGLPKAQFGIISGVFGTIAGVSASIGGGWFISKFSLKKGLYIFGLIQNLAIPVYAIVAWTRPAIWVLGVAVVVEQISAGLGSAAYANFLMRQVNPNYRATHYAIGTGLMALTTSMAGVISGFGAQKYGYAIFFTMAFVASLPGLCLIPFVARRPECQ